MHLTMGVYNKCFLLFSGTSSCIIYLVLGMLPAGNAEVMDVSTRQDHECRSDDAHDDERDSFGELTHYPCLIFMHEAGKMIPLRGATSGFVRTGPLTAARHQRKFAVCSLVVARPRMAST